MPLPCPHPRAGVFREITQIQRYIPRVHTRSIQGQGRRNAGLESLEERRNRRPRCGECAKTFAVFLFCTFSSRSVCIGCVVSTEVSNTTASSLPRPKSPNRPSRMPRPRPPPADPPRAYTSPGFTQSPRIHLGDPALSQDTRTAEIRPPRSPRPAPTRASSDSKRLKISRLMKYFPDQNELQMRQRLKVGLMFVTRYMRLVIHLLFRNSWSTTGAVHIKASGA